LGKIGEKMRKNGEKLGKIGEKMRKNGEIWGNLGKFSGEKS
jgi:hypothetical protein